jgi:hypothetical protein
MRGAGYILNPSHCPESEWPGCRLQRLLLEVDQ